MVATARILAVETGSQPNPSAVAIAWGRVAAVNGSIIPNTGAGLLIPTEQRQIDLEVQRVETPWQSARTVRAKKLAAKAVISRAIARVQCPELAIAPATPGWVTDPQRGEERTGLEAGIFRERAVAIGTHSEEGGGASTDPALEREAAAALRA